MLPPFFPLFHWHMKYSSGRLLILLAIKVQELQSNGICLVHLHSSGVIYSSHNYLRVMNGLWIDVLSWVLCHRCSLSPALSSHCRMLLARCNAVGFLLYWTTMKIQRVVQQHSSVRGGLSPCRETLFCVLQKTRNRGCFQPFQPTRIYVLCVFCIHRLYCRWNWYVWTADCSQPRDTHAMISIRGHLPSSVGGTCSYSQVHHCCVHPCISHTVRLILWFIFNRGN
jgi:hypothetical protein